MKNSIVMFLTGSILFIEICSKNQKLFVETEIQNLDKFQCVEFEGNFHRFSLEIPFLC